MRNYRVGPGAGRTVLILRMVSIVDEKLVRSTYVPRSILVSKLKDSYIYYCSVSNSLNAGSTPEDCGTVSPGQWDCGSYESLVRYLYMDEGVVST
jgi:hypothetical protein